MDRPDGFQALIFDLDGVLWNSNELHDKAFREVCETENLFTVDYREIAGQTTPMAWDYIFKLNDRELHPALRERLTKSKRNVFLELAAHAELRDEDLAELHDAYPESLWAIVTGASNQTLKAYLSKTNFSDRFDVFISADDGLPSKPAPHSYKAAMEKLGVVAEQSAIFEDSRSGLKAAIASGAHVVHITNNQSPCLEHKISPNSQVIACVERPGSLAI